MNTGRLLFVGMLMMNTAVCYSQSDWLASGGLQQEEMTAITNTAIINGAPMAAFDLITTARFWPQWHPASRMVFGVTERPYRLGDRILERGRIGNLDFQIIWKVVEHAPLARVVLQAESSPTRIIYSLQSQGAMTTLTRTLEYAPARLPPGTSPESMARFMQAQSEQAVAGLKALVEKVLSEETIAPVR